MAMVYALLALLGGIAALAVIMLKLAGVLASWWWVAAPIAVVWALVGGDLLWRLWRLWRDPDY